MAAEKAPASWIFDAPHETRENGQFAVEIKFLVGTALAHQIRGCIETRLKPDAHVDLGTDHYRISSLYFDTEQYDVFRRNGSYGRSKLRIRRYGQDPTVFLERKLRTRELLANSFWPCRRNRLWSGGCS